MATIYSVTRTTDPGADCSYPVGTFEIMWFDGREPAERLRDRANAGRHPAVCGTPGVRYGIVELDEMSPDRPPQEARHQKRTA